MGSSDDPPSSEEAVSFGPFCLTRSARLLVKDDAPVEIGSRALELLIALTEHPGEIVGPRELIKRVWPDVFVDEANVRLQVAKLRKALGDGQAGARYIVTVPGRGYCFVAPVQRTDAAQGCHPTDLPAKPAVPAKPTEPVKPTEPEKLPPLLPRMVGREKTVADLSASVIRHRFVSVVGPGGIGKTTVAVSVAHAMLGQFPDAVFFVDLGALTEPALVPTAVASVLGLPQGQDPLAGLLAFLTGRRVLLILDCCEHVVDAVATLTERLFSEAPQVHLLTTSREVLSVEGEHVYLLQSLDVPSDDREITAAQALSSPAVQVFMERAAAGGHRSELSDAEARIVARICRQLDGIPLAIELVASRVGAYGIQGTAHLLDHQCRLRWRGRRTALPRHQTLQAMLDWSYELLSETERRILCRLAVFVGNFTFEAALSIAGDVNADRLIVAEAVTSLVNKSLIWTSVIGRNTYHRLLDATRIYAAAKLADSGEYDAIARRHALYFSHSLETDRVEAAAFGGGDLSAYEPLISNVRAALEWSFSEAGDQTLSIELASRSAPLFLGLSLLGECQQWSERALAVLETAGTKSELALQRALAISSMFTLGNSDEVRAAIERGSDLAEALGDRQQQLHLLAGLNIFRCRTGDYRGAVAIGERSAAVAEQVGSPSAILMAESMLGVAHHLNGHQSAAQRHCELGLKHVTSIGTDRVDYFGYDHHVRGLVVLARALWLCGSPEPALKLVDQAIDEAAARGRPVTLCISLLFGAPVFLWNEDLETAGDRIDWLIRHAAKYSLAPFKAMGLALKGQFLIASGEVKSGVEELRSALSALQAERFHLLETAFHRALAEGLAHLGQKKEAMAIISAAIARAEKQGGTFDIADLLRAESEILMSAPTPDFAAAEKSLLASIDWARRQAARYWEKRSTIALTRLYAAHGRSEEAQQLLADIRKRLTGPADCSRRRQTAP